MNSELIKFIANIMGIVILSVLVMFVILYGFVWVIFG